MYYTPIKYSEDIQPMFPATQYSSTEAKFSYNNIDDSFPILDIKDASIEGFLALTREFMMSDMSETALSSPPKSDTEYNSSPSFFETNNASDSETDSMAGQRQITEVIMPQLEAVTPGSGSYMNEADFNQPNWQNVFYGSNYEQLLAIKNKWDPQNLFYVLKGVGSEAWTVADDGKMCRA